MSEWKECKLGDVVVFQRGHDLPKTEMKIGPIPVAGSNGIIGYHDTATTTGPGITIGRSGNIGLPHFYKTNFWAHNTVLYVKDFKGNDEKYIFYFLNTLDFTILNAGSAVPTLNRNHIHELLVKIPTSLPEQKAIASVLSSLDDKIDLLHRQNKTLEAMAEVLFRQWFVEKAKDDWKEKTLGELLTITSSKRIFYSEYVTSGVPFYRSKEIIELQNTGTTTSELCISNERFNEINSKFGTPKGGDILLTSVGTLGVAYRVKAFDKFYFKDGNLTWFKDFNELPSPIIYLWLNSKIGQEKLATITIGSTQQALTIEGLRNISFKIPTKDIIDRCTKNFEIIISKIDVNQTQISTLKKLRDTLLPKLMSGEVRVEV
jgi:type I restriction enzyme S subunit